MNSQVMTFWELMTKQTIHIPIIQRDYAQGRSDKQARTVRTQFIRDLADHLETNRPLMLDFIYGSVTPTREFLPLDGQQRLTTLFLLHWYLGVKEGRPELTTLSRFSYETRASSREFCQALVAMAPTLQPVLGQASISTLICDSPLFYRSWEHDLTIQSMLVVLDTIDDVFRERPVTFAQLMDNDACPIRFHFIDLAVYGMEDTLYIKMNARGKALTPFEHFKAHIQGFAQAEETKGQLDAGFTHQFMHRLDGVWTDLFWQHRNDYHEIDQQMMAFIRTVLINHRATKSMDREDSALQRLLAEDELWFSDFMVEDAIDAEALVFLANSLNGFGQPVSPTDVLDVRQLFERVISQETSETRLTYQDRVQFYGICLVFQHDLTPIQTTEWVRLLHNLSVNTIYNAMGDYSSSIRGMEQIKQSLPQVTDRFLTQDTPIRGFSTTQVQEERLKMRLRHRDASWKTLVERAEHHPYFQGQIGFLLEFAGMEDAFVLDTTCSWDTTTNATYLDRFTTYLEKSEAIFDGNGLRINRALFTRALLTQGYYALRSNRNDCFLIDGFDRDISWKRLLRDKGDKRTYVKDLLDLLDLNQVEASLQQLITNHQVTDWYRHMIDYAGILETAIGKKRFFRQTWDGRRLLLKEKRTSSYSYEYEMYALYEALRQHINPSHLTIIDSAGEAKEKNVTVERDGQICTVTYDHKADHYHVDQYPNGTILLKTHEDVVQYLTRRVEV